MLKTAVKLFFEKSEKLETLEDIIEKSRYKKDTNGRWIPSKLIEKK
ncbi:MAG TPA: hypothetical protein ACFYDZ_05775 [Candidatus Brocadiaceae bacterium]